MSFPLVQPDQSHYCYRKNEKKKSPGHHERKEKIIFQTLQVCLKVGPDKTAVTRFSQSHARVS